MENKKGQHVASPKKSRFNDTSAHAQRQRLLAYLIEFGSVTTVYARDVLGIMSPAPRVQELRQRGYNIITERIKANDHLGVSHYGVARYVLITQAGGAANE
jgi:hypothetical protein